MKKAISFFAAFALMSLPFISFGQGGKYTIHGRVGNYSSPAKAFLMYYSDETGRPMQDSVVMKNGRFEFSGTVEYPKEAWVIINTEGGTSDEKSWDWRNFIMFYLEPGKLKIICPDTMIAHATVRGGPVNRDNEYLRRASLEAQKKQNDAYDDYYNASKERKKSKSFLDSMDKKINNSFEQRKIILKRFVQEHPNSFRSIYALQAYSGGMPDVTDVEPMFNSLSPAIRASKPGLKYAALLKKAKVISVGLMAPDFTQKDTEGKDVSLHDFKGRYVLIDFWASWCKPCRAENPHVVEAYNLYKDKNFTILGVSLDKSDGRDKWLQAIKDDGLVWTNVSDLKYWENAVAKLYVVSAIPQNFLVAPDGKIIARDLRGDALMKKLKELLD